MIKRDNYETEPQSSPDTATYLGSNNFPSSVLPAEVVQALRDTAPAAPASSATPATLSMDQAGEIVRADQGAQTPAMATLKLRQPTAPPTNAVVAKLDFKPLYRAE
jgi:hypothetical protein